MMESWGTVVVSKMSVLLVVGEVQVKNIFDQGLNRDYEIKGWIRQCQGVENAVDW